MVFYDFIINLPLIMLIPYTLAFLVLLIGSYTDLKTREVPDWVNYGLIGVGFGINLLFSVIYWKFSFIVNSIIGFAVFFVIAYLMFRFGQWGGGDSKMLMGLGALFGIDVFSKEMPFLANFLINALLIGALYGIFWSIMLVIKNKKSFMKAFSKKINDKKGIIFKKNNFGFIHCIFLARCLCQGIFYENIIFVLGFDSGSYFLSMADY